MYEDHWLIMQMPCYQWDLNNYGDNWRKSTRVNENQRESPRIGEMVAVLQLILVLHLI